MAKTDKKTLELIAEIKKQKTEIAKALGRPAWNTNCAFAYVEGSSSTQNIHALTNIRDLICIAAFLQEKARSYAEAAKVIGVDNPPAFNWGGYVLNEWMEDLKLRITKIQIETKKKKLELLESRLNAVISPELRAEMELEAITNELGS